LIGCGVQRLRNVGGRKSGCRCASRQRKTQSGGAQCRHTSGFGQALPLRNLLHLGHVASSMQVFRFQLRKFYVWLMRHASCNEFTNSLLHIHFPFMLINSAPLRHDHDRIRSGRAHTMHCRMGRDRSNLNGRAIRRIRLVRAADDRRVGGAVLLRQGGGLGRAGHLHLRVCLPAFQRRRDACRGTNGAAARRHGVRAADGQQHRPA
jgi:hypothetical protein